MDKELIFKEQSVTAIIGQAFRILSTKRKTLATRAWIPILVQAASFTILLLAYTPNVTIRDWGLAHPAFTSIAMIGAAIAALLSVLWLTAAVFSAFNDQSSKKNFIRSLPVGVCYAVYSLLLLLMQYLTSNILMSWLMAHFADKAVLVGVCVALIGLLCNLVIFAIWIPFTFSCTKYLFNHTTSLKKMVGKDYHLGWKYWGRLTLLVILASLTVLPVVVIGGLPLTIVFMSQAANQLGMLSGDPSGAPSYLLALLIGVAFITFCLMAILMIWYIIVLILSYGNIESREMKKNTD